MGATTGSLPGRWRARAASAVNAVVRPEQFFGERPDPSLLAPTGVVLLSAALRCLLALPFLYMLRFVVEPSELRWAAGLMVVVILGYALGRWLLLAAVVYATSWWLDGEGRFRDLLAYLGWSHLPNVLGGVVLVPAALFVVASVDPPTSEAAVAEFARNVSGNPLVQLDAAYGMVSARTGASMSRLQFAVGVGQFAWGAYIWFAAAKVGRNLDGRRALWAIAIPVVVTGLIVGLEGIDVGVVF